MSDTEDGSDGADDAADEASDGAEDFDKEAEREKLREEYEREQERREATQHMSDLLLKGATMTNTHCDDCGSPIFRYDGEAFCPTCAGTRQVADDAGAAGEADAAGGSAETGGESAGGAVQSGSPEADRSGGTGREGRPGTSRSDLTPDAHAESPGGAAGGDGERAGASARGAGAADEAGDDEVDLEAARRRLDERAASRAQDVGGGSEGRANPPRSTDSPVRQGEVPSMAQSRASLRRAIVSLSEQAAQSDDPGRAHDLLKGAREAAQALAALEGTTGE